MSYLSIKNLFQRKKVCIIFIKNKKFQKPQKPILSGFF
jgi:hypothetical protein